MQRRGPTTSPRNHESPRCISTNRYYEHAPGAEYGFIKMYSHVWGIWYVVFDYNLCRDSLKNIFNLQVFRDCCNNAMNESTKIEMFAYSSVKAV